jgi:hypothetical protein
MLLALLYSLFRLLLDLLLVRCRSEANLQSEVLLLRHQLRVLQRQTRRPRWQPGARLLLAALSRRLPRPDWASFLVSPETILRWHRELVRRKWYAFGRRPRHRLGRPALPTECQQLILRLAARTRAGAFAASRASCASWAIRSRRRSEGLDAVALPEAEAAEGSDYDAEDLAIDSVLPRPGGDATGQHCRRDPPGLAINALAEVGGSDVIAIGVTKQVRIKAGEENDREAVGGPLELVQAGRERPHAPACQHHLRQISRQRGERVIDRSHQPLAKPARVILFGSRPESVKVAPEQLRGRRCRIDRGSALPVCASRTSTSARRSGAQSRSRVASI